MLLIAHVKDLGGRIGGVKAWGGASFLLTFMAFFILAVLDNVFLLGSARLGLTLCCGFCLGLSLFGSRANRLMEIHGVLMFDVYTFLSKDFPVESIRLNFGK